MSTSDWPTAIGQPAIRLTSVVAIPVRNEEARIEACLSALRDQTDIPFGTLGVVLFLNNCTDGTRTVIERCRGRLDWPVRILEADSDEASAGWARRMAMDAAAQWLEAHGSNAGVILTSDADSRVPADWVARNLAAIAGGADGVAGRLSLEPDEACRLPPSLHRRRRLEKSYESLLAEISARLDPEHGNPWPCHWTKSGASIALTLSAYRRIGGVPDLACGEDHALIDTLRAHDLVVRHDPDIVVVTSGRLEGRAAGGTADTMRLHRDVPQTPCDMRLERLDRAVSRIVWRRRLRGLFSTGLLANVTAWPARLALPRQTIQEASHARFFGKAFALVEASSPRLAPRPLRPKDLPWHILGARVLLQTIRLLDRPGRGTGRADSPRYEPRIDGKSTEGLSTP